MKSLNNRGFTLVELLAVLVILISIMSVVVPVVSDSLGRSKDNQDKRNKKMLELAAESFVTDNKSKINFGGATDCYITIFDLIKNNYVDKQFEFDANGKKVFNLDDSGNYSGACIIFDMDSYSFEYKDSTSGYTKCI